MLNSDFQKRLTKLLPGSESTIVEEFTSTEYLVTFGVKLPENFCPPA